MTDTFLPSNLLVNPMLTDLYQISMTYAYWKGERHNETSIFDLFFRKNPFYGEFTIFAGLDEVIRFISNYKFTEENINQLATLYPHWEIEFFDYMRNLDTSNVKVYAIKEGTVVFPRVPLLRIEGPLGICQLLETTLLVLVNYASLVCTNAVRHRLAVGWGKSLLEVYIYNYYLNYFSSVYVELKVQMVLCLHQNIHI